MENCTVSDMKKMVSDKVFDKTIKPFKFTTGDVSIPISDWTDLSKNFVRWLVEKGHINEQYLPIHNHAKRGKYFINSKPEHKYQEMDGVWYRISDYHVDTKYNAECHIKNIISALNQLGVYGPNITVSFKHY